MPGGQIEVNLLALERLEGRNPAGLRLRTDPQKARSQRALVSWRQAGIKLWPWALRWRRLQPAAARLSAARRLWRARTCCRSSGVARSTTHQQAGLRLPRPLGALGVPEVQGSHRRHTRPARHYWPLMGTKRTRKRSPWTRPAPGPAAQTARRGSLSRGEVAWALPSPSPYAAATKRLPSRCSVDMGELWMWACSCSVSLGWPQAPAAHVPAHLQLGVARRAGGFSTRPAQRRQTGRGLMNR